MPPIIKTTLNSPRLSQEMLDLIDLVSTVLLKNIELNKRITPYMTLYCSANIPAVSINDYFKQMAKALKFKEDNFIYLLNYFTRYFNADKIDFLHSFNVHRLALALLLVIQKYLSDRPYNNKDLAFVGGVKLEEVNQLEIEILADLTFDLYLSRKDYLCTKKYLADLARQEEKKYGRNLLVSFSQEEESELVQLHIDERYISPEAEHFLILESDDSETQEFCKNKEQSTSSSIHKKEEHDDMSAMTVFNTTKKASPSKMGLFQVKTESAATQKPCSDEINPQTLG